MVGPPLDLSSSSSEKMQRAPNRGKRKKKNIFADNMNIVKTTTLRLLLFSRIWLMTVWVFAEKKKK